MNSDSLQAFLITTETRSFTKAAQALGLTQSALSQKIMRLESELSTSLFIRRSDGVGLTASGEKLLVHARQSLQLQDEFLSSFRDNRIAGHLRIAGFSSIMRSLIMPKLAPWLRENPEIIIEFSSYEMGELESVLKSNRADLVITDYEPNWPQVVQEKIGEEEYVLVESRKYKTNLETYLDHDPQDNVTSAFFTHQGLRFNKTRRFVGDVYGILDGVALGLGRAVVSKHLIEDDSRLVIKKTKRRFVRPLMLNYYEQSFYPILHKQARELLNA